MTHKHECSGCKHECLHYCKCCNKVYCCKCGQEWGGYTYYQPYYTWWTPTYPQWTTTIACGATCTADNVLTDDDVACSHSH